MQAVLGELAAAGEVEYWVVERSNVAALPSRAQLEGLLELHAHLVQLGASPGAEAPAAGGTAAAEAPQPAGPVEEAAGAVGAGGSAAKASALMRAFVEDAYDGEGHWNWWVGGRWRVVGGWVGVLSSGVA